MSSILINGMKKPENCFHCPMGYRYGDVDDAKLMCTITAKVIPLGKSLDIMKNCPLVEIPPHGELIEKEELLAELELEWNACNDDTEFANKIVPNRIKDAPVIIESEEE